MYQREVFTLGNSLVKLKETGIIHRDLKPENVLVVMADGKPRFKVADFGLARFLQEGPTGSLRIDERYTYGTVCGTAGYIAPEVILSKQYGFKADVFSFGVIVYECHTGRHPFRLVRTVG